MELPASGLGGRFRKLDFVDCKRVVFDQSGEILLTLDARTIGTQLGDETVTDLVQCGGAGFADIEQFEDVPAVLELDRLGDGALG